jgi:hypothetical protein
MSRFDFENVHRNKKLAYLDGFLTGIITTYLVATFWKEYQEEKAFSDYVAEVIHLERQTANKEFTKVIKLRQRRFAKFARNNPDGRIADIIKLERKNEEDTE